MKCEFCGGRTQTGNLNKPQKTGQPDIYIFKCAGCHRMSRVVIKPSIKDNGISKCWRCGTKLSIGWLKLGGDMFHINKDCPVCGATNID